MLLRLTFAGLLLLPLLLLHRGQGEEVLGVNLRGDESRRQLVGRVGRERNRTLLKNYIASRVTKKESMPDKIAP